MFACTFEKSVNRFEKIEFDYDDEHEREHGKDGEWQCMQR